MSEILEKKNNLLAKAKEIMASDVKPDEKAITQLESDLASLFPTLSYAITDLTMEQFTSAGYHTYFYGYLYNTDFKKFVNHDSEKFFLYANNSDQNDSSTCYWWLRRLEDYYIKNKVEIRTPSHPVRYFNWRDVTGACMLVSRHP